MKRASLEISLKDLVAMLLKTIKPIVCAALILGILGACFGFYQSYNSGKDIASLQEKVDTANEIMLDSKENKLTAERDLKDKRDVQIPQAKERIRHAEELVSVRKEYAENSLYYAIDPFHCGISRLTVQLSPLKASKDDLPAFISAADLRLFSNNSELFSAVRDKLKSDADLSYIRELVSISISSSNCVVISVLNKDSQLADAAADIIYAELKEYLKQDAMFSSEISDRFCGYEINWEMRDRNLKSDGDLIAAERELAEAQKDLLIFQNDLKALERAVTDAKSMFDEDQSALVQAQKALENAVPTPKNIIISTLLFFVVMFIVGLFIASFVVLFYSFSGAKILNQNSIISISDYPLFGVLPSEEHYLFDKAIRKLEGESNCDYQSAAEAVGQTILCAVGERSVCFVSSLGKEIAEKLVPFTDGHIPACGNIIDDPNAIKAMSSYDGIILVEKKGLSETALIETVFQRAKALDKEILGMVLL